MDKAPNSSFGEFGVAARIFSNSGTSPYKVSHVFRTHNPGNLNSSFSSVERRLVVGWDCLQRHSSVEHLLEQLSSELPAISKRESAH